MNLADLNKSLQTSWETKGHLYAKEIKAMIEAGELPGPDNRNGEKPADDRNELALEVLSLLKKANKEGTIEPFRTQFPPAYAPFINIIQEQGQSIENLTFISDNTIAFVIGTAYEKRKAYILSDRTVVRLNDAIQSIGKSPQNGIFAIADNNSVITYKGWREKKIFDFKLPEVKELAISQIIPFNDGLSVLLISSEGIYLLTTRGNSMIHPVPDPDDKEWASYIDMEHAALSNDNTFIALGDQCSAHRILNRYGQEIAAIAPQSSYPHYALFSKDGQQVVLNSCHFYNGITIGVHTSNIHALQTEAYTDNYKHTVIDKSSRIYTAVATSTYYIFGDTAGYIKAFDKEGNNLWYYFLGDTIISMTLSDDEKTLWVASCSGMIHTLKLNAGQRDNHIIGNGNHYEEFRIIFWKYEPHHLIW
jgi:hypothetical protein